MKEYQKQKLHRLLTTGEFLNRHAWMSGAIGAAFVLGATYLESLFGMYAGGILILAALIMMCSTDIILWYVKWRKKTWG